jgi:hypothetical protein
MSRLQGRACTVNAQRETVNARPQQERGTRMSAECQRATSRECDIGVRAYGEDPHGLAGAQARRNMKNALAAVLVLALSTVAYAQTPADMQPPAPPARPDPSVAITVSPLHLALPMAEVTAEVRVAPKLGVAVIGGIGRMHIQTTNEPVALVEGGASIRYYVTGSFRSGLQVGGEALYLHGSTEAMNVDIKARGLGLSPFIGYKWTHSSGFTFDGQIGASYMAARGEAATGQSAEKSKFGPLLNLNIGWSL